MSHSTIDRLISLSLFLTALWLYTTTLAPTVLEGDAALFQYTAQVLGVTYPTGFPTYILLGKLWLTLCPFGEIAWRMNLFSAVCAAAAMPLLYGAIWRLLSAPDSSPNERFAVRLSALLGLCLFATMPTFWRWATSAKTYTLNILLLSGMLYLIAQAAHTDKPLTNRTLYPLALMLGLGISVHNTMILLLPGIALLALMQSKAGGLRGRSVKFDGFGVRQVHLSLETATAKAVARQKKSHFWQKLTVIKPMLIALTLFLLPNLAYFYIPLRAEMLIAQHGRAAAIEHGLLADFYHSGFDGFIRYFSAAEFTQGVATDWAEVPQRFYPVYVSELLAEEIGWLAIGLAALGAGWLLLTRPRWFMPLFLIYAIPIPFVLAYGRGQQSAFLLPSFLMVCIAFGSTAQLIGKFGPFIHELRSTILQTETERSVTEVGFDRLTQRSLSLSKAVNVRFQHKTHHQHPPPTSYLLPSTFYFLLLLPFLLLPHYQKNFTFIERKWKEDIRVEWQTALNHPLEQRAGLLAEWADLTPFWYLQHAEQQRPDLHGIYPPTEANLQNALQDDQPVYLAGLIDPRKAGREWLMTIDQQYQLIPWGRLVRVADLGVDVRSLLPTLPHEFGVTFNKQLDFLTAEFAPQAAAGANYPVMLLWHTQAELPPQTTLSLRLVQGDNKVAQVDEGLLSGWFPTHQLPADQPVLSYIPMPIPAGTRAGPYQLQLVVYAHHNQPWPLVDGATVLNLGTVNLTSPPQPVPSLPDHDFAGQLQLTEYEYSASRVGQGKGFALTMLWQARQPLPDDYTLLAELVDLEGQVLRRVTHQPDLPTGDWQTGQQVRDLVDFVLPASAPIGEAAIHVRLKWLRPDGTPLPTHRWLLPWGDSLSLSGLTVTEKKGRTFTRPPIPYPHEADFENKAKLLGFKLEGAARPDKPINFPNLVPKLQFGNEIGETSSGTYSSTTPKLEAGGYRFHLKQADCADGCPLDLELYWQALSEMTQLYSVFLHLVDEEGNLVAQQDKIPGIRSKQPTTGWLPPEIITDPITLPLLPNISAGQYRLRLGLYLPPDGPRLLLHDEAGQPIADFIEVAVIEVVD